MIDGREILCYAYPCERAAYPSKIPLENFQIVYL